MKKLSLLTNIKYMFNRKLKAKIIRLEKDLRVESECVEIKELHIKKLVKDINKEVEKTASKEVEIRKQGFTIKRLERRINKLIITK